MTRLHKKCHLFLLLILVTAVSGYAQKKTSNYVVKDKLVPIDINGVKVGGEIGRRVNTTVRNNILKLNVDEDFLAAFQKKKDTSGGYIGLGKLIETTVRMASYTGDAEVMALKNHLVEEIIKDQGTDGYIGDMIPESRMGKLWDISEMGYIIFGLVNDYKFFGSKQSLAAAEKAADYIVKNWSIIPANWEQATDVATHVGVTGLHRTMLTMYEVTGEKRYLDFCLNQLNLPNWHPGIVIGRRKLIEGHNYAYMAACLAQLDLYRLHPENKLLIPTMEAIDFMTVKNGMTITGGAGQVEIWTDDQDGRDDLGETCATAYQIRVYDNLLRLKGDSRYGDIMERTIYNALFGAQSPDGRQIRYFTPFEGDRHFYPGDTYCCPNNYRRIVAELPSMVYYRAGKGVAINLYSSSKATIATEDGLSIAMQQETDYPNSGHVVIKVDPSKTASFPLKLRIPSWCKEAKISVNGNSLNTIAYPGTFAEIERTWKAGDQVVLDMPMNWRLVLGRQRQTGRVAVMRGPLVFCLNPQQNESLAKMDASDVGRIVIDLLSIEPTPVRDITVRPDGIGTRLKAGSTLWATGNPGNITLTLTEFADPNGKCIYFKTPDLSAAVPDELIDMWK